MTPCTELGCRCADHGVVSEAKKRKSYEQAYGYEDGGFGKFFHVSLLQLGLVGKQSPGPPERSAQGICRLG